MEIKWPSSPGDRGSSRISRSGGGGAERELLLPAPAGRWNPRKEASTVLHLVAEAATSLGRRRLPQSELRAVHRPRGGFLEREAVATRAYALAGGGCTAAPACRVPRRGL